MWVEEVERATVREKANYGSVKGTDRKILFNKLFPTANLDNIIIFMLIIYCSKL